MFRKKAAASGRTMMHCWMRLETLRPRMIFSIFAVTFCFFFLFRSMTHGWFSAAAAVGTAAGVLLLMLIVSRLCVSKFAVKHSAVGRQLKRFGDFRTVYSEICAAAQEPLYTNGTEVISRDYIFLTPEQSDLTESPFSGGRLLILAVSELESVCVQPDALYPDEMNTILFCTANPLKGASADSCRYQMTVHLDASSTQQLADAVSANLREKRRTAAEPFARTAGTAQQLESKTQADCTFSGSTGGFGTSAACPAAARPNSYPYKSMRSPAARSAARFRSDPLHELLSGKLRVFRLVVSLILFVNLGAILFIYFLTGGALSSLPRDFVHFVRRELLGQPDQLYFLLGLAAMYLIPSLFIYIMIRRWYRCFLEQFERLPQPEQKELLSALCDNFETGRPAVIYTAHCICFRNMRMLSFQTLLPYPSILWIYRSRGAFLLPVPNMDASLPVEFCHLVIRTANRRKYRIPSDEETALSRRVLHAVVGYGEDEKQLYREKLREQKWK